MDDPRRAEWDKGGNCYAEVDSTGRYGRFDEVLGKGAMKTVYRAFDELNGIEVAWNQVKMCDVLRSPEALERMYSEVHLLSTLDHESIIRFQASWIDIGKRTFNFITELFTSGSLREYRQRYRRVDIRAIKRWASQILHGLVYLHSSDPPVIHRDLKCDNIFINGHLGQVKIGDLGLAAVLRGSQNAHSVIGTPEFMAPELYEEEYNELVDIYSFGMCVLEMLTSEYPYSECSNPAQIYKKVTSGKLPDAFCRIQDLNARRFIGRCLETASKRSSAKELLLDPFLLSDDHHNPVPLSMGESFKTKETGLVGHECLHSLGVHDCSRSTRRTDMTITGKMNPEDDTIFLKVQITDKDGNLRSIYFPFDIVSDTPIDVANEMVKELEIVDREPLEIAEVIAKEISNLVPNWKDEEPLDNRHQQVYSYNGDDDKDEGFGHPFNYPSSSTSSHVSELGSVSTHGEHYPHAQAHNPDWLRDDFFSDDDDTSSLHSENYSTVNYQSGNEQDNPRSLPQTQAVPKNKRPTRFSPVETKGALPSRGGKRQPGGFQFQMTRNRSVVEVRRRLLHRALVEALGKRLCKTMGAVENIGFRISCLGGPRKAPPSPRGGGRKLRVYGD